MISFIVGFAVGIAMGIVVCGVAGLVMKDEWKK